MRKIISLVGLLAMVLTIAGITIAADEKTMTWTGYISDSACGGTGVFGAAGAVADVARPRHRFLICRYRDARNCKHHCKKPDETDYFSHVVLPPLGLSQT